MDDKQKMALAAKALSSTARSSLQVVSTKLRLFAQDAVRKSKQASQKMFACFPQAGARPAEASSARKSAIFASGDTAARRGSQPAVTK